jgi:hypothetical protein
MKTRIIQVRVTEEEFAIVDKACAAQEESISAYLRRLLGLGERRMGRPAFVETQDLTRQMKNQTVPSSLALPTAAKVMELRKTLGDQLKTAQEIIGGPLEEVEIEYDNPVDDPDKKEPIF